jgi:phosphatidylglycerol:prolipoprotein diacylglycerol transferase
MYPYLHIGSLSLGTFGLLLWLAAVCATVVLHFNFVRHRIKADALNIVALATVGGIVGAKLWHVLESPQALMHDPAGMLFDRAGFAWFGGLGASILVLLWQGRVARVGMLSMLDLAAPAAAVGYGVGRIGCLVSGDGDYGIPTKLPWGMAFPHGLVPTPPGVYVHPTPIYELIFSLIVAYWLWKRANTASPAGWLTGEYLLLSGLGRFLVEFIRINPKLYWGMSNAQVASIGSMIAGIVLMLLVRGRKPAIAVRPEEAPAGEPAHS